jgi:hypothetical protein
MCSNAISSPDFDWYSNWVCEKCSGVIKHTALYFFVLFCFSSISYPQLYFQIIWHGFYVSTLICQKTFPSIWFCIANKYIFTKICFGYFSYTCLYIGHAMVQWCLYVCPSVRPSVHLFIRLFGLSTYNFIFLPHIKLKCVL